MNGKRILVRLIWLFAGINIVLFAINYIVGRNQYMLSADRINNIEKVLEKQGITVKAVLPRNYEEKKAANLNFKGMSQRYSVEKEFFGSDLVSVKHSMGTSKENPQSKEKAQYCSFGQEVLVFDGNAIYYENQGIHETGKKISQIEAQKYSELLIKRVDPLLNAKNYQIESISSGAEWQLTYYPILDGLPVIDSSMTFKVNSQGVEEAILYLANIEAEESDEKEIYPVDLVLFSLADSLKQQGAFQITEVSLIYKRLSEEKNMWGQKIIPAYKIEAAGLERAIFVNAYNNEIIK